jgi:heat shock protein HtpX
LLYFRHKCGLYTQRSSNRPEVAVKFIVRSLLVLLALYGLVFAVGDAYLVRTGSPIWVALVFALVFIGIQFLIGPYVVQWLMHIEWDDYGTALPQANREFIEKLCAERGLKVPRIGIIRSGTPNAFSFGHIPANARVVVTKGLLDVLTPEEANAVLAHEIGHIEHWDFAIMTVAALAPLIMYQFYAFTRNSNNLRAIAYGAFVCYWISQFIVLLLNRTREYFADHYAAEVTHAPDNLSSALVKIAYGMVRAEGEYQKAIQVGPKEERSSWRRRRRLEGSMAVMGISNLRSGQSLALSLANPADAATVMRWDLVNPWARVYEMNSTHPLTALRVRQLNRQTEAMHQPSQYQFPPDQRVHWGLFPLEFLLWAAPFISFVALAIFTWIPEWLAFLGITAPPNTGPILLMFAGVTWMLRVLYRYRGEFQEASIGSLIQDTEVSQMRPRAVRLRGKILGRGLPGAFWSPDLTLQDPTGIIFMLYRQSIPLMRFLFATLDAEKFMGQEVVVEGWFRRGLRPYLEMSKLNGPDGTTRRTYSRWVQLVLAAAAVAAGWLWLTGAW